MFRIGGPILSGWLISLRQPSTSAISLNASNGNASSSMARGPGLGSRQTTGSPSGSANKSCGRWVGGRDSQRDELAELSSLRIAVPAGSQSPASGGPEQRGFRWVEKAPDGQAHNVLLERHRRTLRFGGFERGIDGGCLRGMSNQSEKYRYDKGLQRFSCSLARQLTQVGPNRPRLEPKTA